MIILTGPSVGGSQLDKGLTDNIKEVVRLFEKLVAQMSRDAGLKPSQVPVLRPSSAVIVLDRTDIHCAFTYSSSGTPRFNIVDGREVEAQSREDVIAGVQHQLGWEDINIVSLPSSLIDSDDADRREVLERLAEEYLSPLISQQLNWPTIESYPGGDELHSLITQVEQIALQRKHRLAIAGCIEALETGFAIALEHSAAIDLPRMEAGQQLYLRDLAKLARDNNLIDQILYEKVRDQLNKLRRFGTHWKSGQPTKADTEYALSIVVDCLTQMFI